jgi:hypothetical protein
MPRRFLKNSLLGVLVGALLTVASGTSQAATVADLPSSVTAQQAPEPSTAGSVISATSGSLVVGEGARLPQSHPLHTTLIEAGGRTFAVVDCGWVSCSLYLSRAQTRWLNYNVAAAGGIYGGGGIVLCAGLAAISTAGAAFVAAGCAVVIAVYGGFIQNALGHEASDNGCLRMRYGLLGYAFYDDHSSFCHST